MRSPGSSCSCPCRRRPSRPAPTGRTSVMFGNGPYQLEVGSHRRGDRARSERATGRATSTARRGTIVSTRSCSVPDRPRHRLQRLRSRRGRQRQHPAGTHPGRRRARGATTLDVNILGSYHFVINDRAPQIGGEENLKLRQAISAAIDREDINAAVYNGSRTTSTGITPPEASPASRKASASTARTTPSRPRRCSTSGSPRVACRTGRSRSSSTPTPATSQSFRSSSTTSLPSASRPRHSRSRARPTSPRSLTVRA